MDALQQEIERQNRYKKKARRIQRIVKNMVFENSALCDQVSHIQEKILCVKEERRYLLKKLIEHDKDILLLHVKPPPEPSSMCNGDTATSEGSMLISGAVDGPALNQTPKTRKPYKKRDPTNKKAKKTPKRIKDKFVNPPPPLEAYPTDDQPISLGDSLAIFALGDIIVDRIGYQSENWIYPVGFVSTRIYGHMLEPSRMCVYTCKITDGGDFPVFEIIPDSDMEYAIAGPSPDLCHAALLQTLNSHSNGRHLEVCPQGEWFFGLGHPTVVALLQQSPNIAQCQHFGGFAGDLIGPEKFGDPTVNYEALQKYLATSEYHTVPEVKEEPPDELLTARNGDAASMLRTI